MKTSSLVEDRRVQLIRNVGAWSQALPPEARGPDGLTAHERSQAAKIDQRLKEKKMWYFHSQSGRADHHKMLRGDTAEAGLSSSAPVRARVKRVSRRRQQLRARKGVS